MVDPRGDQESPGVPASVLAPCHPCRSVSNVRQELLEQLETYYRSCGWKVESFADGTVRAAGIGGVTWIGMAVVPEDLESDAFEERLLELSEQRMPAGQRCPFELLPAEECADELRATLERLRLSERGHVGVYWLAA